MQPTSSTYPRLDVGEILVLQKMFFQIPPMSLSAEHGSLLMPSLDGFLRCGSFFPSLCSCLETSTSLRGELGVNEERLNSFKLLEVIGLKPPTSFRRFIGATASWYISFLPASDSARTEGLGVTRPSAIRDVLEIRTF